MYEYYETPTLVFFEKNGSKKLYHENSGTCWCSPEIVYFDDGSVDAIIHQLPT